MLDMARTQILPAVSSYTAEKAEAILTKKQAVHSAVCGYESRIVEKLSELTDSIDKATANLEKSVNSLKAIDDIVKQAEFVRDALIPDMDDLRQFADEAETMVAKSSWPFPTYDKLLFGV